MLQNYIIFDVDDTLLETFRNSYAIFCEIANFYQCGKIDQQEFLEQYMKGNFSNNLIHFFGNIVSLDESTKIYEDFKKRFPKKKLINIQYLESLLKMGYKIGILTNGPELKTSDKLKYLGIDGLCSLVFHEGNIHYKKPESKVFNDVYSVIGTKKVSIIYIGDALVDYFATVNTNVMFYAVLTGYTTKGDFLKVGVDKTKIYENINILLADLIKENAGGNAG